MSGGTQVAAVIVLSRRIDVIQINQSNYHVEQQRGDY